MPQRDLTVHIIGDSRSLERAFKVSVAGSKQFSAAMSRTGNDASAAAREVVAAEVRKGEALRREVALYRSVAASAERGSREQVVAARLASDAERRLAGSMATTEREARRLSAGSTRLNRDLSSTFRGAAAGSGIFRGLGRSLAFASAGFLGGAGLTSAIRTSISAASNLNEQVSKTNQIFRQSAPSIISWGKTTATSIGIANDQAIEAAATFGGLFNTIGLAPQKSANLSKTLVQLAADLASFNNASPEDALAALRSGLVGESEPLRRFQVLLSESRVQQEALRETGKKSAKQLNDQDKVLARVTLILRDTNKAQGDYARTSQGLANSQRTLTAEIRDTQAAVGRALLPAVTDLTHSLRDWLGQSKNQQRIQHDVTEGVRVATQAAHGLRDIYNTLAPVVKGINDALGGTKNTLKLLVAIKITSWATGIIRSFGFIGASAHTAQGNVRGMRNDLTLLNRQNSLSTISQQFGVVGGSAQKANQKVGLLRQNMGLLARNAAITIGITTLFKAEGDKGIQSFAEKILGAALVGGALGGPPGAAIAVTAEIILTVVVNADAIDRTVTDFLRRMRLSFLTGAKIEIPIGTSLTDLRQMRDQIAAVKGQNDLMVKAMDLYISRIEEAIGKANNLGAALGAAVGEMLRLQNIPRPDDRRGVRGAGPGATAPARRPVNITVEQRNQFFDASLARRLNRVQDIASLRGQIDALEKIASAIRARIAKTKDITRRLNLEDQLLDVVRQQKNLRQQIIESGRQSAEEAATKAKEAAADARQAVQDVFDKIVQALEIGVQRAELTGDDRKVLAALEAERRFLQQRLRSDKSNLDLQQQVLGVQARINDLRKQQVEQIKAAIDEQRQQIPLFQGPVLAPTDQDRRRTLGFPGADVGKLTADVRAQTQRLSEFQRLLSRLSQRGAPTELIRELRERGLAGIAEVRALAAATPKQLKTFLAQFRQRERLLQRTAKMEVQAAVVNIRAQRVGRATGADTLTDRTRTRAQQLGRATGADRPPPRARTVERTTIGGRGDTITINVNGARNPAETANEVERRLQKRAQKTRPQTRGRFGGRNRGLA